MSMIQIGCLLVGQTLNITILSLLIALLARGCLRAAACVCASLIRVVNNAAIVKLPAASKLGEKESEKNVSDVESKLMFCK
jgi:hypothetical protein